MRVTTTMTDQTNDYIYTNGCSFTFGIGISRQPYTLISEDADNKEVVEKRWSTLVANHLGMDVINDGVPGSCNERIFRTTYARILTEEVKPKLAVIMWSDPPRTEMFRPQDTEFDGMDLAQINPQSIGKLSTKEHLEAFQMYYAFVHSGERALLHTMGYMVALKHLFETYDIPFIMLHYKSNFYHEYTNTLKKWQDRANESGKISSYMTRVNQLKSLLEHPHIFGFDSTMSFDTLLRDNNIPFSIYSGGHPDEYGHKAMGDWLNEYIDSNNVIG